MQEEKYITIKEFVKLLYEKSKMFGTIEEGYKAGWLEQLDVIRQNEFITKMEMARITHLFLKLILKEMDEVGFGASRKLTDLYDCRTCVNHVAQVYDKGIIAALVCDGKLIFGMRHNASFNEAKNIVDRVFNKNNRLCQNQTLQHDENMSSVVKRYEKDFTEEKHATEISYEEALIRLKDGKYLVIDLRSVEIYKKWHIDNAVNETLTNILDDRVDINKYLKDVETVYVYCEKGYQSEIVANYLASNKLIEAYYFATNAL